MAINVFPVDAVGGVPEYTGREARQVLSAVVAGASSARPLGARSGVRRGTPDDTVTATSTTWTVKPHAGLLDLQAAEEASVYWYAIDADESDSDIVAAHATYARKDIVYVKLDDPAESDGSSVPAVTVLYAAGTASASPAPPATPARSMVLAYINVPASGGGSPTVQWAATYATAAGGVEFARDATELTDVGSYATTENPVVAYYAAETDIHRRLQYTVDGSTWRIIQASPAWTAATLSGSWLSQSGHQAQYRIVGDYCELRGSIVLAAGLTANTANLALTGLPAGLSASGNYPVCVAYATNGTTYTSAGINVRTDGGARVYSTATLTGSSTVTLDGVRYRVS